MAKRVFKTRPFARWAAAVLTDRQLCEAAREIEQGLFEADLGNGLCKKRIAVAGRGKRSGCRALVAQRHPQAIFFLAGRTKNESGADFSDVVETSAKAYARWLEYQPLGSLLSVAELKEICCGEEGS